MRFTILFILVSSGAAQQCNNVLSPRNSACVQNSYTGPYSIFNTSDSSNFGGYAIPAEKSTRETSCFHVKGLPISLNYLSKRPVFTRMLRNITQHRLIDNACNTFFPLPDDPHTFLFYRSVVYNDGSNRIVSYIATDVSPGTSLRGNTDATFTQRIFGSLGNDLYTICSRNEYGDNAPLTSVISIGSLSPIEVDCSQQIISIIECNGQSEGDLYVLPYRLPTRCVTQQPCSLL